jgi:sucrose phosphorylase
MAKDIRALLTEIYGREQGRFLETELRELMGRYRSRLTAPEAYREGQFPLHEGDSIMITYGDQFKGPGAVPLEYLRRFVGEKLDGIVSGVHILPFFPYSSDDGFSIIDYRKVNKDMGSWKQVEAIGNESRLMADLVLNHCSVQGSWFQSFLKQEEPYSRYFITVPPGTDVSRVARPRAHPLLTPFQTADGEKLVWTTFSADQADLDFSQREVFLEMMDILLGYIERGASVIRLDAIAYLWKELGTSCLHHPKTHAMVKLYRSVLEELAPWVVIITETNVPHKENMSYFGDGSDEAHMIYQFSLPPLVLDAFLRADTGHLTSWASSLPEAGGRTAYFNFLASHDGIGLLPAQGILSKAEIENMIEEVLRRGGRISYKATETGDIPYEMNINYLDAVAGDESDTAAVARKFLASQSILLAMPGVPGIYVHSLLGSRNWEEGVEQTGINRSINRQKFDYQTVIAEIEEEGTLRHRVFSGYTQMLRLRSEQKAFHPAASQHLVPAGGKLFALLRFPQGSKPGDEGSVLCIANVSGSEADFSADETVLGFSVSKAPQLIYSSYESAGEGARMSKNGGGLTLRLKPYEVHWSKI